MPEIVRNIAAAMKSLAFAEALTFSKDRPNPLPAPQIGGNPVRSVLDQDVWAGQVLNGEISAELRLSQQIEAKPVRVAAK